jgi:hypothetical protein
MSLPKHREARVDFAEQVVLLENSDSVRQELIFLERLALR